MQSQLFYVGKGIELTDKQFTLNTGIDYLDSKIDPRNNRENFKRVTGSIRTENDGRTIIGDGLSTPI